jgi:hypothetical protein
MNAPWGLIPPQSESQYVLHIPSPRNETHIEDEDQQYDRGLCPPHPTWNICRLPVEGRGRTVVVVDRNDTPISA